MQREDDDTSLVCGSCGLRINGDGVPYTSPATDTTDEYTMTVHEECFDQHQQELIDKSVQDEPNAEFIN